MRLLIITQSLDKTHPILGFFHRWVEEFASQCEQVHVICLEAGEYQLPDNVIVHSLGKEQGKGKLSYFFRFYTLIFKLRHQYDGVFVHMNQIYVILGAPIWRILGKKVGLWYAHGATPRSLKVATTLASVIFTCSADSFKLPSQKVLVTGHGIDTTRFAPQASTKDLDLITVGRITESKQLTTLIEAFSILHTTQPRTLTIVGEAVTPAEHEYQKKLQALIKEKGLEDNVRFFGRVQQEAVPAVLNRATVFVTVAQNGSLDKAMLEAMSCGLPIVSMAKGSASLPLGTTQTTTKEAFIEELEKVVESGVFEKPEYRTYVQNNHSLSTLIPKITTSLS